VCKLRTFTVAVSNDLVNKTGGKVEVIPLVNIPLAGMDNTAVVRSLLDLNSWLTTAANLGANSLPNTRAVFWDTILKEDCDWEGGSRDSFSFMMPVTARNPRKRPFLSEKPSNPLPSKVGPISELGEKKIISTSLLCEVNSVCGLNVDINVSTERSVGPPARHDDCRYVVVGASHMCRVATALREDSANVSSLATPGWKPTSENLEAAANYCSSLKPVKGSSLPCGLTPPFGHRQGGSPLQGSAWRQWALPCGWTAAGGAFEEGIPNFGGRGH
jgi:hypothetical protein